MENVSLTKVGGVCAILTGILAAAGFILIASTDILDAEKAVEALPALDKDQNLIATALWLFMLAATFGLAAALGFFQALRQAGALVWLATLFFEVGTLMVFAFTSIFLAMTYELAPAYLEATGATKSALEATGDTLGQLGDLTNLISGALSWGLGVLLFSLVILRTSVVTKWIGWLGILVAILGGWLALLGPTSDVFETIGFIGFIGFWVWMIAMGVALLRLPEPAGA